MRSITKPSPRADTAAAPGAHRGRRALAVLALCFFFNFVSRGIGDTFLVFLLPLQQEFGWPRAQMTSIYSLLMLVAGLAAPAAGWVFERHGPRVLYALGIGSLAAGLLIASRATAPWHFYVGLGLFGGLGAGAVGMVPATALLSGWFPTRLSTAIGVAYAAFGFGSLVMVPLTQALIEGIGWRVTYLSLGAVVAAIGVVALLLPWRAITAPRPVRTPAGAAAGATARAGLSGRWRASPLRAATREPRFWLMVQVMFFTALGMYLVLPQSVAYLVDIGFTPLQSATAVGAASMLSIAGVSGSGWASDRFTPRRAATASFAGTALGIAMLLALTWHASEWLLIGYVALFGLFQGARGPVVASLSARLFAGPGQATVYGAIYALMSLGVAAGSLLAGALHDWTGGYRAGFLLALGCIALAAAPFWLSQWLRLPVNPSAASATTPSPRQQATPP
ncbi:MAG: MFS transporter [Betaproteobacteria bacterium]|nr:MFS transporter [Betaproteobacteria bacterium]